MIRLTNGKNVRVANRHYFEDSGLRNNRIQKQHPFVVMTPGKTQMKVDVVYTAEELLKLPVTTKVLAQWKGKTRSDYYKFTVRELKSHITEHPPTARQKI
jgi:hypothetical protein